MVLCATIDAMRILLVEDEPEAARLLAKGLREQAYAVDVAATAVRRVFRAQTTDYDAVILDVILPALDGLSVCRELRAAGSSVPILMLTARDAVQSRIAGLDSGADDYLTKPFDFNELLARLRAVIRRGVRPPMPERLRAGSIELDTRSREVTKARAEAPADCSRVRAARVLRPASAPCHRPGGDCRARVGRVLRSVFERDRRLRAAAAPEDRRPGHRIIDPDAAW